MSAVLLRWICRCEAIRGGCCAGLSFSLFSFLFAHAICELSLSCSYSSALRDDFLGGVRLNRCAGMALLWTRTA